MRFLAIIGLLVVAVGCGGKTTTAERVATYGEAVKARLSPAFAAQGVAYPPASLTLIGLKAEKRLEVWAPDATGQPRLLKVYPILAASGGIGPKLREGDGQVPEGLYAIESLNPNSRFHLSLRIDYPNADDRRRAQTDGRTQLGGDIMIHGSNASIGCLAMGADRPEEHPSHPQSRRFPERGLGPDSRGTTCLGGRTPRPDQSGAAQVPLTVSWRVLPQDRLAFLTVPTTVAHDETPPPRCFLRLGFRRPPCPGRDEVVPSARNSEAATQHHPDGRG